MKARETDSQTALQIPAPAGLPPDLGMAVSFITRDVEHFYIVITSARPKHPRFLSAELKGVVTH
jgi:hypothetical protein